jgi:hypothetical protein
MGGRVMYAPAPGPTASQYSTGGRQGNLYQVSGHQGNSYQDSSHQGNGMEELLRGIHQELRGIRQELSGIRESMNGAHAQTSSPRSGRRGPQQSIRFGGGPQQGSASGGQWRSTQSGEGPTMQWRQIETGQSGVPQSGVIYLGGTGEGENVEYRVLSPQGGHESHDALIELGYVSGGDLEMIIHDAAEMELHLKELGNLQIELEALEMIELETILEAVQHQEAIELEVVIEEAIEGELSPQIRVRAVPQGTHNVQIRRNVVVPVPPAPPAPAAEQAPVRQRIRIVDTPAADDPDVQPEDPFFRSPATPEPAKPVITAAGIFGG